MSRRPGARSVALSVLRRVFEDGAFSNLAIAAALDRSGLAPRDRALVSELVYGTLRRRNALDHALAAAVDRPLHAVEPPTMAALRLGAYQLLFMRVPPHAAVGETVAASHARERGFVNAVLRRLSDLGSALPDGEDDEAVSVRTGLAPWGVAELRRLIGSEAEAAAAALAAPAPIGLRVNPCRSEVDAVEAALVAEGLEVGRTPVAETALLVERAGDPRGLPGFEEGWFAVQDPASAFVVASALAPEPGDSVLDACAGPGGKAAHAACLVRPGGRLVAADIRERRAALVARTARRLGVPVLAVAQDARRPAVAGPFDRVLVDAPCSGFGSARRRPELLWRPRRTELSGLARLQVAIAAASAELVRSGGRLVYSVCTFPRAETDAACDALLRARPDLSPVPIEGPDGRAERIRLWPHRHGTDAMFVAAFRRA